MDGTSYRFRLERVRALRERHEDQAKQHLATALRGRQHCQDRIDAATVLIGNARHAQSRAQAQDLLAHQGYLEHAERLHRDRLEELKKHDKIVATRRQELIVAAQEREALERLKTRGLAEHTQKLFRIEQIQLDEIATGGYWRRAA